MLLLCSLLYQHFLCRYLPLSSFHLNSLQLPLFSHSFILFTFSASSPSLFPTLFLSLSRSFVFVFILVFRSLSRGNCNSKYHNLRIVFCGLLFRQINVWMMNHRAYQIKLSRVWVPESQSFSHFDPYFSYIVMVFVSRHHGTSAQLMIPSQKLDRISSASLSLYHNS